jgi:hypothetical protein
MIVRKKTKAQNLELTPFELGWLVGIIEGEGNVNAHISQKSGYLCTSLSVSSTDEDVIQKLNLIFSGFSKYKRVYQNHYKTQYVWAVNKRKDIKTISNVILPYLSKRRKDQFTKALTLINDYENCK